MYHMDIETQDGVRPHGFHLGTQEDIASQLAIEAAKRDGVLSVALRKDGKLVAIYDWRD